MQVLGLDGCKRGWVGILTDAAFNAPRVVGGDLAALVAECGAEVAVIDIPVGLSVDEPARQCEIAARQAMKGRAATVCNTPVRGKVEAPACQGDAAVMARSAGRLAPGKARLFPPIPTSDAFGLPMQMVA